LDLSTADAPCYITNRIQSNAYRYLAERIQGYKAALTTRRSLLETNKDAIIAYGDKLDSRIDTELATLKAKFAQLRNYEAMIAKQVGSSTATAGSLEDLSSFFNYGFPTDTKNVPRFNFWFNNNGVNVPNFVDGAFKQPSSSVVQDGGLITTDGKE
jgi:hypothetical protein